MTIQTSTPSRNAVLPAAHPAYPTAKVRALRDAPSRQRLTVRELADAYMAAYAGRDATRAPVLARWTSYLGDEIASELDADVIHNVLDDIAATPVMKYLGKHEDGTPRYKECGLPKPATINRAKVVLSALLTWAQQRRMMPRGWTNPCREIPGLPTNNARTRFLSDDERRRLLALCRASTWPRLYLLVLLALTTGARKSEMLNLRYRDLDLDAGTAHLHATKNGDQRVLPLVPAVITEIKRFGKGKPDAYLFPATTADGAKPFQPNKAWAVAIKSARIGNFRFHDLRHSCASYLAQSGASLLEIADVLGHKTLDVTRRYSHLTTDTKAALVGRVLGNIA